MKPIALDSKPEETLTHDSRARAGRLNSATPISVSCSPFTHRVSSEDLNESVDAMTCTTPNCASVDQCNQQYSIYALTDSSGNVSERYAYTAYGQPTFLNASATVQTSSAASNRYTYTSREWDQAIGLSHFRARWMSGVLGRFIKRDPTGYHGNTSGLNELFDSQALIGLDPTGLVMIRCNCECGTNVCSKVDYTNIRRFEIDVDSNGTKGATQCRNECASYSEGRETCYMIDWGMQGFVDPIPVVSCYVETCKRKCRIAGFACIPVCVRLGGNPWMCALGCQSIAYSCELNCNDCLPGWAPWDGGRIPHPPTIYPPSPPGDVDGSGVMPAIE